MPGEATFGKSGVGHLEPVNQWLNLSDAQLLPNLPARLILRFKPGDAQCLAHGTHSLNVSLSLSTLSLHPIALSRHSINVEFTNSVGHYLLRTHPMHRAGPLGWGCGSVVVERLPHKTQPKRKQKHVALSPGELTGRLGG